LPCSPYFTHPVTHVGFITGIRTVSFILPFIPKFIACKSLS